MVIRVMDSIEEQAREWKREQDRMDREFREWMEMRAAQRAEEAYYRYLQEEHPEDAE